MIARIRGRLLATEVESVLVENCGIAYRIFTAAGLVDRFGAIGDEVTVHTRMIVRENDLSLYGFPTSDRCQLFDLLQTVTGIGPRVATNILGTLEPDRFALAVLNEDIPTLTRTKGLGKRGAERIILELRDRLKGMAPKAQAAALQPAAAAGEDGPGRLREDVLGALVVLGYSAAEAETLVAKSFDPAATVETNIRQALRQVLS
ncbi:MAG: Holliday junction branch migration protein RuvA [Bacillota bacterium]|nr:Holliday junction branch migration protein RuvA [Bacillota bacterium]